MEVWLVGLLAAFGSSLATFLVSRRLNSGNVSSSTADRLWKEQQKFRREVRREMDRRLNECKDDLLRFQRQNLELRVDNHELIADNMRLQVLTHPEIPDDVKDQIVQHQRDHVTRLRHALVELDEKEKEAAERKREREEDDEREEEAELNG